jgi:hypothetical protein
MSMKSTYLLGPVPKAEEHVRIKAGSGEGRKASPARLANGCAHLGGRIEGFSIDPLFRFLTALGNESRSTSVETPNRSPPMVLPPTSLRDHRRAAQPQLPANSSGIQLQLK